VILGNRALFALLGCVSAVTSGCGGRGAPVAPIAPAVSASVSATPTPTPVTGTATPTPSPTATPTATPTPTPTPTPTATPTPISARPLASGDTFAYAGSLLQTFVYYGSSPNPNATFAATISQTVTDVGTKPFDGAHPYDLNVNEVDLSETERQTVTTDAYVAMAPYSSTQNGYYTYGYTSTDSSGQSITDLFADVTNGNGLLDILPESAGAVWSNDAAQTIAESEADGFTSKRIVAAGGTYAETDTYPQRSQSSSPPPLIATIAENADGSGTYDTPIFGSRKQTFTYSAPASGTITIRLPGAIDTVKQWYTLPLYVEHDRDEGAVAIPAACRVPAKYGSTGNGIDEQFTRVDTVFGTIESFDQLSYVVGGYAVCTTLSDTTQIFYDYSGQGDEAPNGLSFSGGTSPLELATFTSTTGLGATNVSGAARGRSPLAGSDARGLSLRTAFLAIVERRRFARVHRAAIRLRSISLAGSH